MQPYFFPYLGYFQLVAASDLFIFYDDVNFIKRGWINRNKIGLNNTDYLITIPCIKPSQNKLIMDTEVNLDHENLKKTFQTFQQAYSKAPNFDIVNQMFSEVFNNVPANISSIAIKSVKLASEYLGLNTRFKISSEEDYGNNVLKKADRLIDICHREGFESYINAKGGIELYDKAYFKNHKVDLKFLDPVFTDYDRINQDFIPGLSILDVIAFSSRKEAKLMCQKYNLI